MSVLETYGVMSQLVANRQRDPAHRAAHADINQVLSSD